MPLTFSEFAGSPNNLAGIPADGTGSAARFYSPMFYPFAAADGALYFLDGTALRKCTPGAVVTTIAGVYDDFAYTDGAVDVARINNALFLTVDDEGNAYILDGQSASGATNCIRKITPAGTISTIAGLNGATSASTDGFGTAARFSSLTGICLGPDGNLYVTDNNCIRVVTRLGVVTTLAGVAGTPGDTDGTGTAARFRGPRGLEFLTDGNLYVHTMNAGSTAGAIRKVTPAGVVTTLTTTGEDLPTPTVTRLHLDGGGATLRLSSWAICDEYGLLYTIDADFVVSSEMPTPIAALVAGGGGPTSIYQQPRGEDPDSGLWYFVGLEDLFHAFTIYATHAAVTEGACEALQTAVVNRALGYIGITQPLTDVATDTSVEAEQGRLHLTKATDEVLRAFPWGFATHYADLAWVAGSDTDPVNADWTYSYRLPTDCVMVRRVVRAGVGRQFDAVPPSFREGKADANGRLLFSDYADPNSEDLTEPTLPIEYTVRATCVLETADALFCEALAWLLAHKFAPALARNKVTAADAFGKYLAVVASARVASANEKQEPPDTGDASWIRNR